MDASAIAKIAIDLYTGLAKLGPYEKREVFFIAQQIVSLDIERDLAEFRKANPELVPRR